MNLNLENQFGEGRPATSDARNTAKCHTLLVAYRGLLGVCPQAPGVTMCDACQVVRCIENKIRFLNSL